MRKQDRDGEPAERCQQEVAAGVKGRLGSQTERALQGQLQPAVSPEKPRDQDKVSKSRRNATCGTPTVCHTPCRGFTCQIPRAFTTTQGIPSIVPSWVMRKLRLGEVK